MHLKNRRSFSLAAGEKRGKFKFVIYFTSKTIHVPLTGGGPTGIPPGRDPRKPPGATKGTMNDWIKPRNTRRQHKRKAAGQRGAGM